MDSMSHPMARHRLVTSLLLLLVLCAGCDFRQKMAGNQKPILTINKLKLSGEDLRKELTLAAQGPEQGARPGKAGGEPEWISRVVERELLVQEAQRLGLDRNPEFMGTIERFWKEALLKQLIHLKGQEISSHVHVYDPEVEQRYAQMARQDPSLRPLAEVKEDIRRMIRQEKEAQEMERWVEGLKARAKIQMDSGAIAQLK